MEAAIEFEECRRSRHPNHRVAATIQTPYHQLSCDGSIIIPFEVAEANNYTLELVGAGEQYGDEPVSIELSIVDSASGEPALKRQIQDLHQLLLGETSQQMTQEVEATLRTNSRILQKARKESGVTHVNQFPA